MLRQVSVVADVSTGVTEANKHPTTASQRWVPTLTAVAALLMGLDTSVVSTALTIIRLDLHASSEQPEWIVSAYALSLAVLLLTAAAPGTRLRRRGRSAAGLVMFALASVGCAIARTRAGSSRPTPCRVPGRQP